MNVPVDAALRVVLADDHELFREGLAAILAGHGIKVVGQAHDAATTVSTVREARPDIVLLDLEMPGEPAIATIATLRRHVPDTRVIVLTMHGDPVVRRRVLEAGAAAFATKSTPSAELVSLLRNPTARPEPRSLDAVTASPLSPREHEVLLLLARARTNAEIGEALSISAGTVKRHCNAIFTKLGAHSRLQAVNTAKLLGLLG